MPVDAIDCSERLPDWRDVADELATVSLFGGGKIGVATDGQAMWHLMSTRPMGSGVAGWHVHFCGAPIMK